MSTPLRAISQGSTQALSNVFGQINKLEKIDDDIITLLPEMSDDDVMDTRNYAKTLGRSAWRIEIACDAEIWNRTQAKRGRGNVDTEGVGIKATIAKRAAELGCTPRTIEQNARVHKLVQEVEINDESTFTILEDKGYWQAALASSDPKAALDHFVEEKTDNPFFSASDAYRWSKGEKESKKPHVSEQKILASPETRSFLTSMIETWKDRLNHVPDNAPFIQNLLQGQIGQIQWQLDRTPETEASEIVTAIEEGWQTGTEIYQWLQDRSYFMREPEMRARLVVMCDMRIIYEVKQGGRKDNQRGDLTSIYKKFGDRTGDAFTSAKGNSIYDMGDPE